MEKYDIIIAGAGPAGLSVAAELSKKFDILIFDKEDTPSTTHAWYSYEDRVKKYKLKDAVLNRCNSLLFKAIKEKHIMKDKCVVLDGNLVLKKWYDQAMENGANISRRKFLGYKKEKNGVIVRTDKGNARARLLIDCTGYQSPILKKQKLMIMPNTWVCYGAKIEGINIKYLNQIKFLPLLDRFNTYTTFYPISKNKADFYIFRNLEKDIPDPEILKSCFRKALKKFYPKAKKISLIKGNIVSGELKEYALDNVIFFGESGMLTPPACGMGFNQILMKHKKFAEEIKKAINSGKLDAKSLSKISLRLKDNPIINFQRIIAIFSYYFINSPDKWDGGVKWLNALGGMSKHWMRNEADLTWIKKATIKLYKAISLDEMIKYIPKKDFVFISAQFARFIERSLFEEAGELLKQYHSHKKK